MILNYITLFNVGKYSETLLIDRFERTEDLIVWESEEQYFGARKDDPQPIDGGVFTYGLVTGVAGAPDNLITNQIVSFLAPTYVHGLVDVLNSLVQAMRSAEWPDWSECT